MGEVPALGGGVYSLTEAADILRRSHRLSRRQIRSWLSTAETFRVRDGKGTGPFLTFGDLVSLEVVARLREQHLSAHAVSRAEQKLRRSFPDLLQPFAAVGLFFTDGLGSVWAALDPEGEDVVEIVGHRPQNFGHMVIAGAIRPYVSEIRIAKDSPLAESWGLSQWVEIDPRIQYGRPVVKGTRVLVSVIAANLEVGTPAQVADWYGLTVDQVSGARDFAAAA